MTGPEETLARGRTSRRGKTPWRIKRRRALIVIVFVLLPVIPALVWRARLAGDVRERLAALEDRGVPVTLAQLDARLPQLSEDENGALRYREALRQYQGDPAVSPDHLPLASRGSPTLPARGPIPEEQRVAMRARVDANTAALAEIRRASGQPGARYIDSFAPDGEVDLSHGRGLVTLGSLACYRAILEAEAGAAGEAMMSLNDALGIARSLQSDGLVYSDIQQRETEAKLLEALERVLNNAPPPPDALSPFDEHFSVENRARQIRYVLETEQALFIARIREGRRRGLFKNLVIAAGVGDLNLRARLEVGELATQWTRSDFTGREAVQRQYDDFIAQCAEHPLLYVTLLSQELPSSWLAYNEQLDRAAVVEAWLGVYRYWSAHGRYPNVLEELVPSYLAAVPLLASSGEPIAYGRLGDGVELHNRAEGSGRIHFELDAAPVD